MTRITVVGCGYLGAVHAACLAAQGHEVLGVDTDAERVALLQQGRAPFYEPHLADLLATGRARAGLEFTVDVQRASDRQVHFLCVGTPQRTDGYAADIRQLEAALDRLLPCLAPGDMVVGKSTAPVGTAARFAEVVARAVPTALVAWNPEFLREGTAVADTLRPSRIVYGLPPGSGGRAARRLLDQVYATQVREGVPVVSTDHHTAELIKLAANAFLATKISFINAMAELCQTGGADIDRLADALGRDPRIGRDFLDAGMGFGGSCLPKDVRALIAHAEELASPTTAALLRDVDTVNRHRRDRIVTIARQVLGPSLRGRRIALLGASFKANSDDIRDSPACDVALRLSHQGAVVRITDPRAMPGVRRRFPDLDCAPSVEQAVRSAELVVLLTDWDEYRTLDPVALGCLVDRKVLVDGRRALDAEKWEAAGWLYRT